MLLLDGTLSQRITASASLFSVPLVNKGFANVCTLKLVDLRLAEFKLLSQLKTVFSSRGIDLMTVDGEAER